MEVRISYKFTEMKRDLQRVPLVRDDWRYFCVTDVSEKNICGTKWTTQKENLRESAKMNYKRFLKNSPTSQ